MTSSDYIKTRGTPAAPMPRGLRRLLAAVPRLWRHRSDVMRWLDWLEYRRFSHIEVDLGGEVAQFSLQDFYSRRFFCRPGIERYVHEPVATAALLRRMRYAKSFGDIGANLGHFTVVAGVGNRDAQLLAVEMDGSLRSIIERNVELNGLRLTHLESVAVGAEAGEVLYTPHPLSFLCKVTGDTVDAFRDSATSPVVRLADVFDRAGFVPEVLKIDIDGAELHALEGMHEQLRANRPDLFLEVHRHHLPRCGGSVEEVLRLLGECGYRCFRMSDFRGSRQSVEPWPEIENGDLLQSETGDMLFVTAAPEQHSWLSR